MENVIESSSESLIVTLEDRETGRFTSVLVEYDLLGTFLDKVTYYDDLLPSSLVVSYGLNKRMKTKVFAHAVVMSRLQWDGDITINEQSGPWEKMLYNGCRGCACYNTLGKMELGYIYYESDIDEIIEKIIEALNGNYIYSK